VKYCSLDVETTGLDHENCSILEIGALIEDTENPQALGYLPTFHCYVVEEFYCGQPYALQMNAKILHQIATRKEGDGYLYLRPEEIGEAFYDFLFKNEMVEKPRDPVVAAGKNFAGFDLQFLDKLPDFAEYVRFHHRTIDPAMFYLDFKIDTRTPPNLQQCLERAGIKKEVAHTAIEDAFDVIQLVRHAMSLWI
jgi:oligoribonuclease